MIYNILFPIKTTFRVNNENNINESLKKLVKLHYNKQMTELIVSNYNNSLNYLTKVNYYTQKGMNKISLNTFPLNKNILLDYLSNKDKTLIGNIPPHLRTSIPLIPSNRLPIIPLPQPFVSVPVIINN